VKVEFDQTEQRVFHCGPIGHVVSPRPASGNGPRIRLIVAPRDFYKERRKGMWTLVTDMPTGVRYNLRAASCGLDCQCDAEYEIKED